MSTSGPAAPRRSRYLILGVLAVAIGGANLRPLVTAVGPVLQEVQDALGMGDGVAGVLTGLPGLMFGAAAIVAVPLARRLGVNAAMTVGMLLIALCGGLRVLTGSIPLFLALTAAGLIGAGIGNIVVPVFIKRHFDHRQALLTSIYTSALAVGGTTGALAAAPLEQASSAGWQLSVGVWGIVALLAALPWVVLSVVERRRRSGGPPARRPKARLSRSPHAVALAVFFGTQSAQAYVQFGWVAQMFRDAGASPTLAGSLASLIAGLGIPAGLVMPHLVQRVTDLRPVMASLGGLLVVGWLGILIAPLGLPWVWALCLGLSGFSFPAAIALITARTRRPEIAAQVSGYTQGVGYLVAAAGPFVIGLLHTWTGGWTIPLLVLAAGGPVLAVSGMLAGRHGYIDDELERAA